MLLLNQETSENGKLTLDAVISEEVLQAYEQEHFLEFCYIENSMSSELLSFVKNLGAETDLVSNKITSLRIVLSPLLEAGAFSQEDVFHKP
jgi:hypothetical protein